MIKYRFFYLRQNGRIIGPLAAAGLRKMFNSGALSGEDEISPDKENWYNAAAFFNQNWKSKSSAASLKPVIKISSAIKPAAAPLPSWAGGGEPQIQSGLSGTVKVERREPTAGMFLGIFLTMFMVIILGCSGLYLSRRSQNKVEFFGHTLTVDNTGQAMGDTVPEAEEDNGTDTGESADTAGNDTAEKSADSTENADGKDDSGKSDPANGKKEAASEDEDTDEEDGEDEDDDEEDGEDVDDDEEDGEE